MWVHVLSFVDVRSVLAGVSLVSRHFHALASEPQLWRHLLLSHFTATAATATNLYADDAEHGWRKTFFAHRWLTHSVHSHIPTFLHSSPFFLVIVLRGVFRRTMSMACRSGSGSVLWATSTVANRPSRVLHFQQHTFAMACC